MGSFVGRASARARRQSKEDEDAQKYVRLRTAFSAANLQKTAESYGLVWYSRVLVDGVIETLLVDAAI